VICITAKREDIDFENLHKALGFLAMDIKELENELRTDKRQIIRFLASEAWEHAVSVQHWK
jgi:hypothetical protein